ncbi:unnamed protein product [Spodoptera exigua]|nr:unnamed protein product [Spodoptera exigua]
MSICAACNNVVEKDYLECQRCSDRYHFLCLDISLDEGNKLLVANNKWICLSCSNKQPKSSDPVRPSTPTGLADITFNVTRRKVQNKLEIVQASTARMSDSVSRSDIREEMRSVMNEFMSEMRNTLNLELRELRDQISGFKDSLGFLSAQFDNLNSDVAAHNSTIKLLKNENEQLRSEVAVWSNRVRQMDQLSRSTNIELQCVPEHKAENVLCIVKQLGQVVKFPISDGDIAYCSRVAKSDPKSSRPRTILVKFSIPRIRDSLLAATIQYNKDNPNKKLNTSTLGLDDKKIAIFVTENLTMENKNLHAATRLRAKELNYKFVWVRGGRVYVRKSIETEKGSNSSSTPENAQESCYQLEPPIRYIELYFIDFENENEVLNDDNERNGDVDDEIEEEVEPEVEAENLEEQVDNEDDNGGDEGEDDDNDEDNNDFDELIRPERNLNEM